MTEPPGDVTAGSGASDGVRLAGGELQDRAVRGAAWTMLHTVVSVPIAFAVNLLLARVLAPEGYGRLAFLTTLVGIVGAVLSLGLTAGLVQFGAKAHAAGRPGDVRRMLSASQGFRLLVAAPVLTVLVVLLVDVPLPLLLLAIAFGVWVPAALDGALAALFIENRTATGAQIAMLSNLVVQAGVVVAILWIGTADGVWATRVVLTAIGIGLAVAAVPLYRRAVLRPRLPRGWPPGFWRFALPTGLAALIGELALSRTEVLYLTWLSTPQAVGLFALAFGVAGHVFAPAHALTGPLLPAISGLREVEPGRVHEAFGRTMRATTTVVALLSAAAVPALATLVPLLYGEEYADAAAAVLVLGVVGGLVVASGPLTAFVLSRLSGRVVLRASLTALVVDVVVALALIPLIGLWGAVASNAAAGVTQVLVLLRSERLDLGLGRLAALAHLGPALLGAAACVAGWGSVHLLDAPTLLEAVLASLVALALLLGGLRITGAGIDDADRDAVLRVLPARTQGPARRLLATVTVTVTRQS